MLTSGRGGPVGGPIGRILHAMVLRPFTRQRLVSLLARPDAADLGELAELVASGRVRPAIEATYPLERAQEAIRHVTNTGLAARCSSSRREWAPDHREAGWIRLCSTGSRRRPGRRVHRVVRLDLAATDHLRRGARGGQLMTYGRGCVTAGSRLASLLAD